MEFLLSVNIVAILVFRVSFHKELGVPFFFDHVLFRATMGTLEVIDSVKEILGEFSVGVVDRSIIGQTMDKLLAVFLNVHQFQNLFYGLLSFFDLFRLHVFHKLN